MSRRNRQPTASTPPSPVFTVPSPLSISFDPNTSIKVALDKPEARNNSRLAMLLAFFAPLVALWTLLFYKHVVNRLYSPWPYQLGGTPLSVTMAYPARSALGDDNDLDLIVTNTGNDSFTGNLVISMTGAHLLPNETGAVKIENLNSKESKTYRVKFTPLPKAGWFSGGVIRTSLQTYSGNRLLSLVNGDDLPIARLNYARALILWLRNSAIVIAIATLLWEAARKFVFKWEAK